jgi:hypothetical protein
MGTSTAVNVGSSRACPLVALLALGCGAAQTGGSASGRASLELRADAALGALDSDRHPTPAPTGPTDPQLAYPADRYILGRGEAGPDQRGQAESRARAQVAQQIESRIDSELVLEDSQQSHSVDGVEHVEQRDARQRRIRQEATFTRAELIRIDPKHSGCDAARCQALAVLDRQEAAAEFSDAVRALHAEHAAAAKQALAAGQDSVAFSPPYRLARTSFDALVARSVTLHGLLGTAPAEVQDAREAQHALDHARARMLTTLRVTLLVAGTASATSRAVAQALTDALRNAGVQAVSAAACAGGLGLQPTAELACKKGYVGHHCKVLGALVVTRCAGGVPVRELALGADELGGMDPRSEPRARERALQALREPAAQKVLLTELNDVLPL